MRYSNLAAVSTTPLWASPWFWCFALPFLLLIFVLGIVGVIAVLRAQKEDVPGVLKVFTDAVTRLSDRLPKEKDQDNDGLTRVRGGSR